MRTSLVREEKNQSSSIPSFTKGAEPVHLSEIVNGELQDLPVPNLPLPQTLAETGVRNGMVQEFFVDGTLKEEVHYLEGVQQGAKKVWYANGQVAKIGNMLDDRWHGKYEEWYEDGNSKVIGQYVDGKQDGEWLFFDKEGNLVSEHRANTDGEFINISEKNLIPSTVLVCGKTPPPK